MISPSDINAKIAAREAEVERLRRDLEISEAKLRGMKELRDQILGTMPDSVIGKVTGRLNGEGSKVKTSYRGGRQPGAISKEWRAILAKLYCLKKFDESAIIDAAKKHDINLKHSNARLQMATYIRHGYVQEIDGVWNVTGIAAQKFGFLRGTNENEAPTSELEGAS